MQGLRKEMDALIVLDSNKVGVWYSKQVQGDVRKKLSICLKTEIASKVRKLFLLLSLLGKFVSSIILLL